MKKWIILGVVVLALIVLSIVIIHNKNSQVCIKDRCFNVEIADSFAEQEKGLMNRESLNSDSGMIFVFPDSQVYSFWMKNTLIPLDMLWIDEDYSIVYIKNDAQPCKNETCESINPGKEAKYVLEINSGLSEIYGFKIGDKVDFYSV